METRLRIRDPIFIFIIVALSFFWYGTCQSNKVDKLKLENEERIHTDKVAAKDAEIKATQDALANERTGRAQDSVKFSKRTESLKQANTTMARKLAINRPDVQPYLDSLEEVGAFVALQDSAIAIKDSLIVTLSEQIDTLRHSYNRERRLLERQVSQTSDLAVLWKGQSENYEAMFRKADRKSKRKFTVGPYVGYGIGSEGLSPSVGVSLQYRLLRF